MNTRAYSFRKVALSPTDIKNLSINRLGSSDSTTYEEDDEYSFSFSSLEDDDDVSGSLSDNDDYEDQPSFAEESVFGCFRWTDLTKVADESPGRIQRTLSKDLADSFHGGDRIRNDKTVKAPRRRKSRAVAAPPPPPPPPFASDKPQHEQSQQQQHSTELGERISLLLNSPTNSPRSVMGWDGTTRVVGRKTLKKSKQRELKQHQRQHTVIEFETPIVVEGFIEELDFDDDNIYDDNFDVVSVDYESLVGSCM